MNGANLRRRAFTREKKMNIIKTLKRKMEKKAVKDIIFSSEFLVVKEKCRFLCN